MLPTPAEVSYIELIIRRGPLEVFANTLDHVPFFHRILGAIY